jgi:hypothetical protein
VLGSDGKVTRWVLKSVDGVNDYIVKRTPLEHSEEWDYTVVYETTRGMDRLRRISESIPRSSWES